MGIFNKKPPKAEMDNQSKLKEAVKCPKCGTSLDVNGKCLNGHRTEAKAVTSEKVEGLEVSKAGGGFIVSGKIPKDFDPSNKEMVKKFVLDTLREAGTLPEGVSTENFDVETHNLKEPSRIAEMLSHFHSLKTGDELRDIPLPQDLPKAEFVRSFNSLHRRFHEMAPITADLLQSLECMRLSLKGPNSTKNHEKAFAAFEGLMADVLLEMGKFGEMVCSLHQKIGERGVPLPDSTSNTIN